MYVCWNENLSKICVCVCGENWEEREEGEREERRERREREVRRERRERRKEGEDREEGALKANDFLAHSSLFLPVSLSLSLSLSPRMYWNVRCVD